MMGRGRERERERRRNVAGSWNREKKSRYLSLVFARRGERKKEKKKKTLANETYSVERIGSLIFRNGRVSGNEIGQKHD